MRTHRTVTGRRTRQGGVALVTALLVVSLATVAAVAMATRLHLDMRRTGNLLHGDLKDSEYDSLAEDWATALPPIAVEGGYVNGRITDLQGRFNLNNLLDENGKPDEKQLDYYKRLLAVLELEPALAPALLDWMDADINATFPDGAEDDIYLLAEPPYRAANRPLVSTSELRLVQGYTPEVIALLAPHVSALPGQVAINVNTATPAVLRALHGDLSDSDAEMLIADQGEDGYTDIKTFLAHDALAGLELAVDVSVTTEWFSVLTDVQVGRGQARLESTMHRSEASLQVLSRIRTRQRLLPVFEEAS